MLEKTKIAEWFQPRLKCVDSTLMISTTISTTDIPEPFGSNLLGNRLGPRCNTNHVTFYDIQCQFDVKSMSKSNSGLDYDHSSVFCTIRNQMRTNNALKCTLCT